MFLRIGHRGARAYEIENTIASFQRAIELGVNALELDVRRSKDGKLVISHDDSLKKIFGKEVKVGEATLEELKLLTDGKIPTLGEALRFIDRKAERILVELKERGYERAVLDVIKREELEERVIIVSFHEEAIGSVRKLDEQIETGLIYTKFRNPIDTALKLGVRYLVPLYRFVHTKDVEKAHKNNLKVIVWTINSKEEAKAYIAKGVDGIASDQPDIFKGLS